MHADVVVIGAGLAGLTAAWRLHQAGLEVVVLEARDRVGGRLHTVEVDGERFELGGQWIAPYQDAVRQLIAELGLELFQRHREGERVHVGADHGEPDPAALAELRALVAELDPEAPWTHPRARELDAITFDQWLGGRPGAGALRFVADGFMTKPADAFSLLQAAWLLSSAGEPENLLDEDLVLDARVAGGAQRLPEALAARLGDRVRLGSPVRDVAWSDAGVEVAGISARAAVVAVPPNLMATIRFDPPLPGHRLQADQWVSQGALIKVQAAYPTPFWREDGRSGTGFGADLVTEVYDNTVPGGPGVLVGFVTDRAADAAGRLPLAERRARVLADLATYFGPAALAPTHYVERDWTQEEWTRGAYSATFAVGGLARFGAVLRAPIGPLRFAGSDIAGVGTMHMDGAVRSGAAAAVSVITGKPGQLS